MRLPSNAVWQVAHEATKWVHASLETQSASVFCEGISGPAWRAPPALEVPVQPRHQHLLVVHVRGLGHKVGQVGKKLAFVDGQNLVLVVAVAHLTKQEAAC